MRGTENGRTENGLEAVSGLFLDLNLVIAFRKNQRHFADLQGIPKQKSRGSSPFRGADTDRLIPRRNSRFRPVVATAW
jgi:hypothetical protein